MKKIPINVTDEGCAFALRTGYERHAYLNGMTRGGAFILLLEFWKFMRIWIIPMKGKGHEVTARNIALGDAHDECRPLTTDPKDNVLLMEYGYCKGNRGAEHRIDGELG